MGQTLTVNTTTDFSGTTFNPAVDALTFTNLSGTTVNASFTADQVGPGEVSPTLLITGSAGVNRVVINLGTVTDFQPQFTFSNWSAADRLLINGTTLTDTIYGTAVADVINGNSGDDTIFDSAGNDTGIGGNGDDTFAYTQAGFENGDTIDGRADSDTLYVGGGGVYNFFRTSISNVETLLVAPLFASSVTVNFLGSQLGGLGRINTIQFSDETKAVLTVTGALMDLSEMTITNFDSALHTVTLKALAGTASSIVGSTAGDIIIGGAQGDSLEGFSGDDVIRSSLGSDLHFGDEGNDKFMVLQPDHLTAGEMYDGGGGNDKLIVKALPRGLYDFTGITLRSIETLVYEGPATVRLSTDWVDFGVLQTVVGSGRATRDVLQITSFPIAISNIVFKNWTALDLVAVRGSTGNDFLGATQVRDLITGKSGADVFSFSEGTVAKGAMHDKIADFETGIDTISLDPLDADGNAANGDNGFALVSAFTGVAGQLTSSYSADTNLTFLTGDVNGDGKADFVIEVFGTVDLAPGSGDLLL